VVGTDPWNAPGAGRRLAVTNEAKPPRPVAARADGDHDTFCQDVGDERERGVEGGGFVGPAPPAEVLVPSVWSEVDGG
jgi:hypothetical protein